MKLAPKQKLLAIVAGLAVVAGLIIAFLIVPQFTRLSSLESDVMNAQSEADAARALLEQRQDIKTRSGETETQRLRLANQLPQSPELPTFIIELQDTINESGLEFSELSPAAPEDSGLGYTTIGLTLTVRGEWRDVVDLTQRLRRVVRQIRIVSFDVSQVPRETQEGTPTPGVPAPPQLVTVTMDIEIYSLTPPQPPAPQTPPAP